MKEKKTLRKEIYVRIYDKKLVDKYEEVKNSKREKVTDNDFAQELIKLGLSVLTSSKEGLENFVDSSAEMKRMLGVIIKELRKQSDNNSVISEINNKKSNELIFKPVFWYKDLSFTPHFFKNYIALFKKVC